MPNTELYDVIVNKISKSVYDSLVASGDITADMIANEVWIFTDDQYVTPADMEKLNSVPTEAYWQARTGRALNNSDCVFLNVNKTDFTDVPLGNIIQFNNCSGSVFYLKFIQEGATYKLVKANSSGQYDTSGVMAHGSLTNMAWDHNYVIFPYNLVNYYSKVTILINNLNIIDNLFRINNCDF